MVNTVPSRGSVGGAALAAHKDVDKVAFTGSTVTGRKIMEAAANSNLKKVSREAAVMPPRFGDGSDHATVLGLLGVGR